MKAFALLNTGERVQLMCSTNSHKDFYESVEKFGALQATPETNTRDTVIIPWHAVTKLILED